MDADDLEGFIDVVESGGDINLYFDCGLRDGMFTDDGTKFAVYSKEDIAGLVNVISGCVGV